MPMTFPAHQGLIAPLWRRWPGRFDVVALCVGAAMPDIVDGAIGIFRGRFGQGIGHSLLGLVLLCVPAGLLIRALVRRIAPLHRNVVFSLAIGVFSHLCFDLVSHGHFPWLLPWVPKVAIYPDWWYDTWFSIPLPWRPEGRKIGPHATIWFLLSVCGAWMLFREWRARNSA